MVRSVRLVFVAVILLLPLAAPVAATSSPSGFRAISGAEAQGFRIPADVVRLWSARLPNGLTQTRFQQVVDGAQVLGGQVTVLRDKAGVIKAVIGAHYPGLVATNAKKLTAEQARGVAAGRIGVAGRWTSTLKINPANGRLFYAVENRRFDSRMIHWIDATSGVVLKSFDAIAHDGTGIGAKGDTKTVDSSLQNGTYVLVSDGNARVQRTYDMRNGRRGAPGVLVSDANDTWDTPGVQSPGHPAAVDAHVYGKIVADYYFSAFGRNSIDNAGMAIVSSVHYAQKYNNAFWNGSQMTYGDGDQREYREFSASLEVVGHELTHGVTDFTSNLIYQDESGALNESFSDIIGATIEQVTNEPVSSNCVIVETGTCNDWALAEDLTINSDDDVAGFRNMADPQEDKDPDHYSELVNDPSDSGGVHTNSGISNHAYYLLVNGGKNAGCDAVPAGGHTHAADCNVSVPALGLSTAVQIFYAGFTSLPENANFCNARAATLAVAGGNAGAVGSAWDAVGVKTDCVPAPPPPVCETTVSAAAFESRHPYRSYTDCTWNYTHASAGFKFVFSRIETEANFDYVYVYDAAGTEINKYTGVVTGADLTSGCITTQAGSVRLVTDQLINKWGFEVIGTTLC
jgi:Zn-dependent metalloprotease